MHENFSMPKEKSRWKYQVSHYLKVVLGFAWILFLKMSNGTTFTGPQQFRVARKTKQFCEFATQNKQSLPARSSSETSEQAS